ncbi:polar amino acid transport system substrate-binding protein [Actinoplanes lutulentus]|uniref:Amino acid ABC transporter substrate-binding protein (PAAT family) n=1 Tax=Actinoplanes lutulentus TaxID=1287878 RepID=A0A327ZK91_9ACTN|nr:transporter substrate-binding domain-containing protein [Actinoplanes lutulentus]MBB2943977.1 polar amino acid transport system substrate-binding protein [Actinoplanes lutulentus]RAK42790.1 amino acid ABC transporter substrate-binding protein (PAAT family) [Actinoplanes lutulentus]
MRTRITVGAMALVLLLAGCTDDAPQTAAPVPVETTKETTAPAPVNCDARASLRPSGATPAPGKMPARSYLETIQKRGRLVLGTSQDSPLFSSRNPFSGKVEGFDIDMGKLIAKAIFGDENKLQIRVIPHADRTTIFSDGADTVDLVINTMTANCARWEQVDFSTTYLETGQRLLVAEDSTVDGLDDLKDQKVCAAVGSTSLANLQKAGTGATARNGWGECLVAFQQNEVVAISTDDTILAGLAAQDPFAKVVGPRFTEEPYAVAISKQHPDLTRFVNAVLDQSRRDGTWKTTYEKWLGALGPAPQPPAARYR